MASNLHSHIPSNLHFNAHRSSIGDYWLGKTIGRGASGRVKLGIHQRTGERVAIKMIARSQLVSSSTSRSVQRELAILQLLYHPYLVELRHVLQDTHYVYFVMEYVEGGELFQVLSDRGRLSENEARRLFHQLISGLHWCHSRHICHRDLKPENILLDRTKKSLKIADFGMAAMQSPDKSLNTSCGSPHYASPEIIKGRPYDGRASDVWSTGVILYALLTGHLPFDDTHMGRLLLKIKTGQYRKLPRHLSEEAKELLRGLLVVDPHQRMTTEAILKHAWFDDYCDEAVVSEKDRTVLESTCPTAMIRAVMNPEANPRLKAPMITTYSDLDGRIWETLKILWRELPPNVIVDRLASKGYNVQKMTCQLLLQRVQRIEHESMQNEPTRWQETPAPLANPTLQPSWRDENGGDNGSMGCSDSDPGLCDVELPHTPKSIPRLSSPLSFQKDPLEQLRQRLWDTYDPNTCALYDPLSIYKTPTHSIPAPPPHIPSHHQRLFQKKTSPTCAVTHTSVTVSQPVTRNRTGTHSRLISMSSTAVLPTLPTHKKSPMPPSWLGSEFWSGLWSGLWSFSDASQKHTADDFVFDCCATHEYEAANKIHQILKQQCLGKLRGRSYQGKTLWSGTLRRTEQSAPNLPHRIRFICEITMLPTMKARVQWIYRQGDMASLRSAVVCIRDQLALYEAETAQLVKDNQWRIHSNIT
ncbi:kinase-like domain-containing protein [Spinellus fusiger]|nr:kinase-like domain-containing protein [Spinellus fusiger]